jgi:hypothetical protein
MMSFLNLVKFILTPPSSHDDTCGIIVFGLVLMNFFFSFFSLSTSVSALGILKIQTSLSIYFFPLDLIPLLFITIFLILNEL